MELYLYVILIVNINFVVNIKTKCLNYFIFPSSLEKNVKKFLSFGLLTRAALNTQLQQESIHQPHT